jgi:protein-L-isoaspartate O-methyltransferase
MAMQHPERFDPTGADGTLIESEHQARYGWAAQFVSGKDVLDAGCGSGFGIEILATAGAKAVTGVDVDPETVRAAESAYGGHAAGVIRGDLGKLPFDDASFDVVVCFEAIEHVEQAERALAELRRVLRADGLIVVSSPNPGGYPEGNRHHVHEFRPDELAEALRDLVANVALYRQDAWLGSTIASADISATDAGAPTLGTVPVPDEATYSVAIGSDSELPSPAPLAVIGKAFELRWWSDQVATAASEVAEARQREVTALDRLEKVQAELQRLQQSVAPLQAKAALVDEAEARAAVTRAQLVETSTTLLDANQELAQIPVLRHRLDALEERHSDLSDRYHEVLNSTSWRVTAPLRRRRSG